MKIAVTADVHLAEKEAHPERYSALENILAQLSRDGIEILIIAGDLFDAGCQDYSRFEELCREFPSISLHIIPGNHDTGISSRAIVGDNINIHSGLDAVELGGVPFIFIPYQEKKGMAEGLAGFEKTVNNVRWIMVGHGDYFGGFKERNLYEGGTYMPLYRKDIKRLNPWRVFLGHIHKPSSVKNLHYPGSPCGLDINEEGKRSFLVLDASSGSISRKYVDTDVLFFNERFVVIPSAKEKKILSSEIEARIESWGLKAAEREKVRVRVSAMGFSTDRECVMNTLKDGFGKFRFYRDQEPDISSLKFSLDKRRSAIAQRATQLIEGMEWKFGEDEPDRDDVIQAALAVIYGEVDG